MSSEAPRPLRERYLHLTADGEAQRHDGGDEFWSRIDEIGPSLTGWLVTSFSVTSDLTIWEQHPQGEEVFILHRGEIEVIWQLGDTVTATTLRRNGSLVIPKGAWHRWTVVDPGEMTVLTYGQATIHKPLESS